MPDQKALPQTFQRGRLSASARLDRLPITSFHRRIMWLLGFVYFFELGDINSFSFAAPAIRVGWHLSIRTIGFITSATFVGMFVGATTGGWFSDRIGRKRALILSSVDYDAPTSRLISRYAFIRGAERDEKTAHVIVYTVGELAELFGEAGFIVEGLFASPAKEPFYVGAPRLLMVARKTAVPTV